MTNGLSWQEGNSKSNNHSVQLVWADNHLKMRNTSTLEMDRPQKQKAEAAMGTGLPKLYRQKL